MDTPNQAAPEPRLLDEAGIARFLCISTSLVRKDRYGARCIPFVRIRSAVRYDPARVMEAMRALEEGASHMKKAKREQRKQEEAAA